MKAAGQAVVVVVLLLFLLTIQSPLPITSFWVGTAEAGSAGAMEDSGREQ